MVVDRREALTVAPAPTVPLPEGEVAGAPVRQSSLWRDGYARYIRNKGAVARRSCSSSSSSTAS